MTFACVQHNELMLLDDVNMIFLPHFTKWCIFCFLSFYWSL